MSINDLMKFVPTTTKEIVFTIIIVLLLVVLLLYNKALMKCRDINLTYVDEQREYEKYLLVSGLDEDYQQFKKDMAIKKVFGDNDV